MTDPAPKVPAKRLPPLPLPKGTPPPSRPSPKAPTGATSTQPPAETHKSGEASVGEALSEALAVERGPPPGRPSLVSRPSQLMPKGPPPAVPTLPPIPKPTTSPPVSPGRSAGRSPGRAMSDSGPSGPTSPRRPLPGLAATSPPTSPREQNSELAAGAKKGRPVMNPATAKGQSKSSTLRGLKGTLRHLRNDSSDDSNESNEPVNPPVSPRSAGSTPTGFRTPSVHQRAQTEFIGGPMSRPSASAGSSPTGFLSTIRKKRKRKAAQAKINERAVLANMSTAPKLKTDEDIPEAESLILGSRQRHTAILNRNKLIIYGGCTNKATPVTNTVLIYDTQKKTWQTPMPEFVAKASATTTSTRRTTMECRYSHTSVIWNGAVYSFGGLVFPTHGTGPGVVTNTTLWYHPKNNQWSIVETTGNTPAKRKAHNSALIGSYMFIFGGMSESDQALADFYKLNLETMQWTLITATGQNPPPRYLFGMTSTQGKIYLFGGYNGHSEFADLYAFNPETNAWSFEFPRQGIPPPSKQAHTLTGAGNQLYLIGGANAANENQLDTLVYSLELHMWAVVPYEVVEDKEAVSEKQNRLYHTAVANPFASSHQLFLFGGSNPQNSPQLHSITFYVDIGVSSNDDIAALYNLPRADWEAVAMSLHPEILELKERLRSITKTPTYGRIRANLKSRSQLTSSLTSHQVLQLVMEWLVSEGHAESLKLLQRETGEQYFKLFNNQSNTTTLELLLSLAKRRLKNDNIWSPQAYTIAKEAGVVEVIDHLPGFNLEASAALKLDIWDEDVVIPQNLKISLNNTVVAGTLNSLVQLLADYDSYFDSPVTAQVSEAFTRVFFLSLNSFTSPDILLTKISQLYDVPDELDDIDVSLHQISVIGILRKWIQLCADWDWKSDKLRTKLLKFIEGSLANSGHVTEVRELKTLLNKSSGKPVQQNDLSVIGRRKEEAAKVNPLEDAPEPIVPKNIFSSRLTLDDISELELARQLTIITFDVFKKITPPELCRRWWNSDDADFKSPNVRDFVKRSAQIKRWVLESMTSTEDKKNRQRLMERFIKIVEALRQLNNFDSCFSILSALQSPLLSANFAPFKKQLEPIQKLLDATNAPEIRDNAYIATLEKTIAAKAPMVPFLWFMLHQLERLEKSQVDHVENGMINFDKRRLLVQAFDQLRQMQSTPYKLLPVFQIASRLNSDAMRGSGEGDDR